MHPLIAEIQSTGRTTVANGEVVPVHSNVGPESGLVLQHAVEIARPTLACEVGLAFGLSTLYILDAMAKFGGGRLIGIDPDQHGPGWRGGGLHNVRRAGFGERYELREQTSQTALPQLASAGTKIQFAFIDGWHTFDHTLVDFFYIDQMLDIGGLVVLDDVSYPGLQRLAHFIVTNRAYTVVDLDPSPGELHWKSRAKKVVQRLLHPLVRDHFTPDFRARALEGRVERAQLVVLRKEGHDHRPFDHFVAF